MQQVVALLYYLGFSLLVASVTRFGQTFSRSNITGKIFLDFRFLSEILKWIPMVPLVCSMKYFLTDMFSLKMISRGLRKMNIICVTCKMSTGGTFPANHVHLCMRAVRRLWTPESSSICFISSLSVCQHFKRNRIEPLIQKILTDGFEELFFFGNYCFFFSPG